MMTIKDMGATAALVVLLFFLCVAFFLWFVIVEGK